MSNWIEQYAAALDARDAREQAHRTYIDAFTRLADRTAAASQREPKEEDLSSPAPTTHTSKRNITKSPDPTPPSETTLTTLRADLTTTQRARALLQTQLETLTTSLTALQLSQKDSTAQLALLTRQKQEVERRLRDREEEIRGKTRLVEETQDEMVSLQLQLNMAEQKSEKLQRENEELVERWMKRVGEEAERANREGGWE